MDSQFTYAQFMVTCKTKDCENAEIAIEVTATESDTYVMCGACSKQITQILPVSAK